MTIQPISPASLVLFLTDADLQEHGIRPHELTAAHTLELARRAGFSLTAPLEIETYPDQCGVLVFVRLGPAQQTVWRFEDLEALLAACAFLEDDGVLYWWDDRFWLVLPARTAPVLSEFAAPETADVYILGRLEEYGTRLPSPAAFRRHFLI